MARGKRRLNREITTTTSTEARAGGLSWYDLKNLKAEGAVTEIAKGVLRRSDAPPIPYLDLVAVCKRFPAGIICLTSALRFWDLTDEFPEEVDLAVRREGWRPAISFPPTRIHTFASATFDLGRERVEFQTREAINIYSAERSVVDAIRLHRFVGTDLGHQALRQYLRRQGAQPGILLAIARSLRSERAVRVALEILI